MSGKPIFEPKVSLKTAPVDEEPPMPSRTTWEYCRRRTSSAKPRMSSECPRMMVGEVSQPSRFRTVAASPFQSVASFTQRRSRNSRDSRKRRVSSTAGSLSGSGSTGGGLTTAGGGAGRSGAAAARGAGAAAASRRAAGLEAPFGVAALREGAAFASAASGLIGALSAPSSPASSCPILVTCRACSSLGSYWVAMKVWAISIASLASRPGAARQRTLASVSSRLVRAAAGSWQRAARIPRILLAAITPPVPLPQRSRLASTKPRRTACPTARA